MCFLRSEKMITLDAHHYIAYFCACYFWIFVQCRSSHPKPSYATNPFNLIRMWQIYCTTCVIFQTFFQQPHLTNISSTCPSAIVIISSLRQPCAIISTIADAPSIRARYSFCRQYLQPYCSARNSHKVYTLPVIVFAQLAQCTTLRYARRVLQARVSSARSPVGQLIESTETEDRQRAPKVLASRWICCPPSYRFGWHVFNSDKHKHGTYETVRS